jgi:hypothetical protein
MKPTNIVRKIATFSLITITLGSISLVSLANGHDPIGDKTAAAASTAEVKYITGNDGESIYNVVYNNTSGGRFSVTVVDAEGDQLFQGVYSGKKFDKRYLIVDPSSYSRLTFIIRNFSDNSIQRFEANSSSRLVEDIEVKEVK